MAQRQTYLDKLKTQIEKVQFCSAFFERTEHVMEQLNGEIVWEGDVEVFWINSPTTRAKRCYGWLPSDAGEFVTMLHLPPIDSAQAAVRAVLPPRLSYVENKYEPMRE